MAGRAHQSLSGPGCGMGKRRSSTTPHSPPESRAGGKSKRVPVPGQSRSWLPAQAHPLNCSREHPTIAGNTESKQ